MIPFYTSKKEGYLKDLIRFFNMIYLIIGQHFYLLIATTFFIIIVESFAISLIIPVLLKISQSEVALVDEFQFQNDYLNNFILYISEMKLETMLIIFFILILIRALVLIMATSYRFYLRYLILSKIKKKIIRKYFKKFTTKPK